MKKKFTTEDKERIDKYIGNIVEYFEPHILTWTWVRSNMNLTFSEDGLKFLEFFNDDEDCVISIRVNTKLTETLVFSKMIEAYGAAKYRNGYNDHVHELSKLTNTINQIAVVS